MLTAEWSIKPRVGGSEQKLKSADAPNPSSKSKPKPNPSPSPGLSWKVKSRVGKVVGR